MISYEQASDMIWRSRFGRVSLGRNLRLYRRGSSYIVSLHGMEVIEMACTGDYHITFGNFHQEARSLTSPGAYRRRINRFAAVLNRIVPGNYRRVHAHIYNSSGLPISPYQITTINCDGRTLTHGIAKKAKLPERKIPRTPGNSDGEKKWAEIVSGADDEVLVPYPASINNDENDGDEDEWGDAEESSWGIATPLEVNW